MSILKKILDIANGYMMSGENRKSSCWMEEKLSHEWEETGAMRMKSLVGKKLHR
jgi:hypothetical protein